MKIVAAVRSYYPHEGGVQAVAKYIAEGLAQKGHDVTILTLRLGKEVREEVFQQVRIKRFDIRAIFKSFPLGDKKNFRKALLEECKDADVFVNVCANSPLAVLAYQEIDHIKCRKILHQHGMFDGKFHFHKCHSLQGFLKMLFLTPFWELFYHHYWNKIVQFDDCIHLFEDDSSHSYFKRHGYLRNHVVMNSCESTFFDGQTDQGVLGKYHVCRPYYIYVANYYGNKNQLRAVKTYLESGCKATDLVLVGSTPNKYYSRIQALLEHSPQKDRVHLLSAVPRQDTIDLIKNAYAFLMTSNSEYFPISIIEAMASGKPFICTDVGVVSQLPGGKVCQSDQELTHWLRYYESHPAFVEQMGAMTREYAAHHCYLPRIIDQVESIFYGRSVSQ